MATIIRNLEPVWIWSSGLDYYIYVMHKIIIVSVMDYNN